MKLSPFFFLIFLFAGFGGTAASQNDARMMVHLLDYISVDYSMAVYQGEIIDAAEYEEMREFAESLIKLGDNTNNAIKSDLQLLAKLIEERSSQQKVSSVANLLKKDLIKKYKLEIAPKRWPDLEKGAALFAVQCASCHGKKGKANGPLAQSLDPPPTNFHEVEKANGLAPFNAYNTIRLGLQGTGMRAFTELSDDEVWDLAFYVLSLPHREGEINKSLRMEISLEELSSENNTTLREKMDSADSEAMIAALRVYPKKVAQAKEENYFLKAVQLLERAEGAYRNGDKKKARHLALSAYLEGIEPLEAKLRAHSASFSVRLESQMAHSRSSIESDKSPDEVSASIAMSISMIEEAQAMIAENTFSGWMAFLLAASIILREGLEAFLVVLAILGIIRAMRLQKAARWIHGGWISALVSGLILWFLAGRLFSFSGAQRELMEGIVALFAVGVLIYVGFWMHSKSESGKWQHYIKNRIGKLAKTENMLGLALLSFLVVFREAFESVLFLSALRLEIETHQQWAFGGGILAAFGLLAVIAVLILRFSRKIVLHKLFRYSAMLIAVLTIILTGKGINALQEAGILNISLLPLNFSLHGLGLYPTWETTLAQVFVLSLVVVLWNIGQSKTAAALKN